MAASFAAIVPEGFHGDLVPGAYKEMYVKVTGDASPGSGYAFGLTQVQALVPAQFLYQVSVANNWWDHTNSVGAVAVYDSTSGTLFGMVQGTAGAADAMVPTTATLATASCVLKVVFR